MRLIDRLAGRPVIAVFRAPDTTHFAEAVSIIRDEGISAVEFTFTTNGAADAIADVRRSDAEAIVGAGTIRTIEQAQDAISAGAQFLVSQLFEPDVVDFSERAGIPLVPGSLTPNEIARAWKHGVQAVKVSPIGPLGGVSYFNELRGPLPDIPMIPTGGVDVEEVGPYLAAGAVAVGISRALFGDSLTTGDFSGVAERARRVVAAVDAGSRLRLTT
jgi:2-dehydro-3-deoxyphosphogluconate aldolase/(4S)-4-hydroxy-2-oxoglutarate aldolase